MITIKKLPAFAAALAATAALAAAPAVSAQTVGSSPAATASAVPTPAAHGCLKFALLQTSLESQIQARQAVLNRITARLDASASVTSSDKAAIQSKVSVAQAGMAQLLTEVQAQKDVPGACKALDQDGKTMVVTYRVYMIVAPQSDLTIAADAEAAVESKLQAAEPTIANIIALAQKDGKNVTNAQAAFAQYKANVANAQSTLADVSTATLLAQTPQDCASATNSTTCPSTAIFKAAYGHELAVRTDFLSAKTDLQSIIADL